MLPDQARSILSDMLRPIDYDDFFEKIMERQPLVIRGDKNPERTRMLGEQPRDTILKAYEQFAPTLTCHAHAPTGPKPKARPVESEQAFLDLLSEYHNLAYTVRIPDVTSLTEELKTFIRALEVIVENPADVVIFWSLTDAKAPIHHDRHDIFCIQLVGEKKWFISKDQAMLPNPWKAAGEGPPPFEQYDTVTVKPGDLIYLPRGTAHTVHSQTESIHLSIGFSPVTVREALTAMIDHLSDQDRSVRTGLFRRADGMSSKEEISQVASHLQEVVNILKSKCDSEEFVDMALQRRKTRMIKDLPKLTEPSQVTDLNLETRVRHKLLSVSHAVKTDRNLDISQPDDTVLVHLGAEEAVNFVTNTEEFTIADVPGGLDPEVKLALVGKFLSTGLLEVVS